MAKKKSPSPSAARCTYTARGADLKILGYVEATNDKEALRQARKRFGAASVERPDAAATEDTTPADGSAAVPPAADKQKPARKSKRAPASAAPAAPEAPAAPTKSTKSSGRVSRSEGAPAQKLSALDAAALVLAETGTPLSCQEMIAAMAAQGYWSSPKGRTPAATLYSAILRELKSKGNDARFRKTDRGRFARTAGA
jgi:hypothetical protein